MSLEYSKEFFLKYYIQRKKTVKKNLLLFTLKQIQSKSQIFQIFFAILVNIHDFQEIWRTLIFGLHQYHHHHPYQSLRVYIFVYSSQTINAFQRKIKFLPNLSTFDDRAFMPTLLMQSSSKAKASYHLLLMPNHLNTL